MSHILTQLVEQVEARVTQAALNAAEIERTRIAHLIAEQAGREHAQAIQFDSLGYPVECQLALARCQALRQIHAVIRGA